MKHGLYLLVQADLAEIIAHYKNLSPTERYYRFGRSMTDAHIERQIPMMQWEGSTYGFYHWGRLVGVAHIIKEDSVSAEFAVSVDSSYQGKGIGKQLLDACMELAETRNVKNVDIYYISENQKMASLAAKVPGKVHRDGPETHKQVNVSEWLERCSGWTFNLSEGLLVS